MLEYLVAFILSFVVLGLGFFLAKSTKEEMDGFFDNFVYSQTISVSIIFFIIGFLFNTPIIYIYLAALIFAIIFFFLPLNYKVLISFVFYFQGSQVLAFSFNKFLLSILIIHGFVLSSIIYQLKEKVKKN